MELVPPYAKKHVFRPHSGKIFLPILKFDESQEKYSSKACPNVRIHVFRVEWNSFHSVEQVPKILLKVKVEHVPQSIEICLFGH